MDYKELLKILNLNEVKDFIGKYKNHTPEKLLLKFSNNPKFPIKEIIEQIECRKKASKKLPNISKNILLYKKVSLEQASSELTAEYKTSILKGKKIIDLTGGLGVDSIYFSKVFDEVIYCEQNEDLAEIASYNFKKLGIKNIKIIVGDSLKQLENFKNKHFDWIYIDPARRDENRRSVDINYYSPDIITNFDLIKSKTNNLCLKLAPAFDINEALKLFPLLNNFSLLSVKNECKEVLVFFNFLDNNIQQTKSSVILKENENPKIIESQMINELDLQFINPTIDMFFYDPDVSIKKIGLTSIIAEKLGLKFINKNSDYLLSESEIPDFPGRKFKIIYTSNYNLKNLKKYLKENKIIKANISRSNFPQKPEEIKKLLNLKDGGDNYFFFTKDISGNLIFILANKISE